MKTTIFSSLILRISSELLLFTFLFPYHFISIHSSFNFITSLISLFFLEHTQYLHVSISFCRLIYFQCSHILVWLLLLFLLWCWGVWLMLVYFFIEFTNRCSGHLSHRKRFQQGFSFSLSQFLSFLISSLLHIRFLYFFFPIRIKHLIHWSNLLSFFLAQPSRPTLDNLILEFSQALLLLG